MPLIPYNFIPVSKKENSSNYIQEQEEQDFIKNNPVLIYNYHDENKFKRIYSDGLIEEGIKDGELIRVSRRFVK